MNKIKRFFTRHTWMFIIIAIMIFVPQSFNYQAKLNSRIIVSGLAIDKTDDMYEVTAQIVMPTSGSEAGGLGAKLDFVSEVGNSVAEGVQKIAYKVGKNAGLSHANFVILGQSMLEENIVSHLDYFVRYAEVSPAITLMFCDGSAKDMIAQTKNLELSVGISLQKLFINKELSLSGVVMPVIEFINGAFNQSKSSIASGIYMAPEGDAGLNSNAKAEDSKQGVQGSSSQEQATEQQSSAGSGQSGGSEQDKNTRIKYYNDVYYFKAGKYINKMDSESEILGMFWTDDFANAGDFNITHVSGGELDDATVGLELTRKRTSSRVDFKNGHPVLVFNVELKDLQISEIMNRGLPTLSLYDKRDKSTLSLIEDKVKEKVEKDIKSAFEKAKIDQVDIFDISEKAYQRDAKGWDEYIEKYGEAYINNCIVEVNVNIKNIN